MDTGIIAQVAVQQQIWTVAEAKPELDLDTDLWTMTASDGRTIYAPTAEECAEMCKCYEIARSRLDYYEADGTRKAAADYAFDAYADHCADQV